MKACTSLNLRVLEDAFSRVMCELVELLSLGETSLCTLVPQDLSGQHLTLNLSSALPVGRVDRSHLRGITAVAPAVQRADG